MSSIPVVKLGFWTDYDQNIFIKYQLQASGSISLLLQVIIAFVLGLVAPSFSRCIERLLLQRRRSSEHAPTCNGHKPVSEHTTLLVPPSSISSTDQAQPSYRTLTNRTDFEQPQIEQDTTPDDRTENASTVLERRTTQADDIDFQHEGPSSATHRSFLTKVVSYGLLFVLSICSVFSADVTNHKAGISAAQECGIWDLPAVAGGEERDMDNLSQSLKETRASNYARDCYKSPVLSHPDRCNFFYNQSISYSIAEGQRCPFNNLNVCIRNLSAVALTTGLVGGDVIGWNDPDSPTFRRNTTCAPLSLGKPFVKLVNPADHNETEYKYYFGRRPYSDSTEQNLTFSIFQEPFEWELPSYAVTTHISRPNDTHPGAWIPIPSLNRPSNTFLTIIFIAPCLIRYSGPSTDDIFSATEPCPLPDADDAAMKFCRRSGPPARPIACIDSAEVCSPTGTNCRSIFDDSVYDQPDTSLFAWSLRTSRTYDSLKFRLGSALLAQDGVDQFLSPELENDHWIKEVEALFATSLARIQYDAFDIMTGADKGQLGYVFKDPEWAGGRYCQKYKFKVQGGYTNFNVVALVVLAVLTAGVFGLGYETQRKREGGLGDGGEQMLGYEVGWEKVQWALPRASKEMKWVFVRLYEGLRWSFKRLGQRVLLALQAAKQHF